MNEQTQRFYTFGEYKIEKTERLLMRNGEVVPLPPKAVELLFVLLENNNRVVTKEELMSGLGGQLCEEANLSRNVFRSGKFWAKGKTRREIHRNDSARGYRFAADLRKRTAKKPSRYRARATTLDIVIEEEYEVDDATNRTRSRAQNAAVQISGN